ncbi:hypothetical protein EKO27_g10049 [Xylaria grammica]|uniref:Uncharacterized protein n=1 Tax=Xylaria grammica TaxID=363999 RepID=A0A439CS90_9PEZI|nr:hypothetical protein EKO27_g10049 [Xylaria grammica]
MVERDTGSDDHIVEDAYDADRDAEWLFAELERYNRRPPWYLESDPDDYGAIDPIFQGDSLICLAYRGARRRARGQARFYGQAALRVKIQELNGAPSKHKEAVVRKLLDIISPELRLSVETWVGHPYRKKRLSTPFSIFALPYMNPATDITQGLATRSCHPHEHDHRKLPPLRQAHWSPTFRIHRKYADLLVQLNTPPRPPDIYLLVHPQAYRKPVLSTRFR